MGSKLSTTRNTAFNGYFFEEDWKNFYASIASTSVEEIKKITKNSCLNIKLLDSTDYIKLKGTDIVNYTMKNKEFLTDETSYGYNEIIQNSKLNTKDKDFYMFGAPYKMVLDNTQAYGDCGVESVMNNLINAGIISLKDQNSTEKNFLKQLWDIGLASDNGKLGVLDRPDGGMSIKETAEAFELYGISANWNTNLAISTAKLGKYVRDGYGIVLSVSSEKLWRGYTSTYVTLNHAVSVIGVLYENENPTDNETPIAFIIHHTACQMTRFITPDELKYVALYDMTQADSDSLAGKTGVGFSIVKTSSPIKNMANNLNATGDKNPNSIYGNLGNNLIKGLSGDDFLMGKAGNDTIYGGDGDDIIFGDEDRDVLYGDNGNDFILGGDGRNVIYGGSGNDTLYGGSDGNALYGDNGNDVIYGGIIADRIIAGNGNDEIHSGAGNDTIVAGSGNDEIYVNWGNNYIETGAGDDTIIFEDENHELNYIYNSSGSVTFKYEYDINNIIRMTGIAKDSQTNNYHFFNLNSTNRSGIMFVDFFNYKNNSSKTTYLINNNETKYRISATRSAKATVADTRMDGIHKDINNILFTVNKTGTTVTTSKKNDVILMHESSDVEYSDAEFYRKDKITYTGGKDTYSSVIGDTTYVVNFDNETNLIINDSTTVISKAKLDELGKPYMYEIEASKNDEIIFSCGMDNISFFFDMDKDGCVTENTSLFALYKDDKKEDNIKNNMIKIATKIDKNTSGVQIGEFFSNGKELGNDNSYGRGLIEEFYTNENGKSSLYNNLRNNIDSIKSSVLNWFEANAGYDSVFEALSADVKPVNIDSLIECFVQKQV